MTTLRNIYTSALVILVGSAVLAAATASGNASRNLWLHLMRPTSAETTPDPNGFVQRWLILEPIAANGDTQNAVQEAVKTEHLPMSLP